MTEKIMMLVVIWVVVIAGMWMINSIADSAIISNHDAKNSIESVRNAGTEGLLSLAPDQITVFNVMLPVMGIGLSYGITKS